MEADFSSADCKSEGQGPRAPISSRKPFSFTFSREARRPSSSPFLATATPTSFSSAPINNGKSECGTSSSPCSSTFSSAKPSSEKIAQLKISKNPRFLVPKRPPRAARPVPSAPPTPPVWKGRGYLTPVADQGGCCCCWAFSTCTSLDVLHKLSKGGKLLRTSPMDLVNSIEPPPICTEDEEEREEEEKIRAETGCFPYWIDATLEHIKKHGVRFNDAVPFEPKRTATDPPKSREKRLKIKGYVPLPTDEESLMYAVQLHPVPVTLEMTKKSLGIFSFYPSQKEIFKGAKGRKDVDQGKTSRYVWHTVVLVGYLTTVKDENVWIVMNSYGEKWGSNGFGYIYRESSLPEGYYLKILDAFCVIV